VKACAPLVMAVLNHKGGVGKTTLSMNLAAGLARRGSTVVVDLDPQTSATQWAAAGAQSYPAAVKQWRAHAGERDLRKEFGAFQYAVLDCPPAADAKSVNFALEACDVALIPVLPSPMDLWASLRLPRAIQAARERNPQLRAWLLLNQLELRSAFSAGMREALAEFGIPLLRACVRRRSVYKSAALDGVSVYQMGSRGLPAVAEIEGIIEEVLAP
jgi:chromosome partitioning protein